MKKQIQQFRKMFIPSSATLFVLLGVVILLVGYFLVSQYSNNFISQEGYGALDGTEGNLLIRVIYYLPWTLWLDRALDFASWGVIASIVLVIAWSFSASKAALTNHVLIENFKNFKEQKKRWHQNFLAASLLRVVLVFSILYFMVLILIRFVPELSLSINNVLSSYSPNLVLIVIARSALLWLALSFVAICVKTFKHVNVL